MVRKAKSNGKPAVRIEKLSKFRTQKQNANLHTERGLQMLAESMSEDGYVAPMTAAADGEIIDGSARLEKSLTSFKGEAIVIDHDGTRPIITRRTDIKSADSPEAKRIALRANRIAQADLDWNSDVLAQLKDEGVELSGMFTEKELAAILPKAESRDAEPQIDKAAELQQKWQVQAGEIIQIGRHRLICGDSTERRDVEAVCAGNRPLLMVTDPPYGVEYNAQWRQDAADKGHLAKARRAVGKVTNDNRSSWLPAFEYSPSVVAYVWHASASAVQFAVDLMACGFEIRNQIIWSKPAFAISRGHYNWQHEPCWYAVRKGMKSRWIGDHSASTLWEISNRNPEHTDHSTEKPLECMARPIRNHEGDVYDPFVGSGTTIVAAENLNRTCYAMEISPEYCAVILERMTTAFPHLKIEREAIRSAA